MSEQRVEHASGSQRVSDRVVWFVGLLAGAALAGRALSGDLLLNWDLVIGPEIPIPPGLWGLGPELPRRTPFYVPLSLVGNLLGGARVVGLLLWFSVASAVAGMERLLRRHLASARPGAVSLVVGLSYGLSPFLLSRAAVGHLPLVVATAMLPWLLVGVSNRSPKQLYRWAALFGLLGSSGAVLGLVPIGCALLLRNERWSERLRHLPYLLMTQACWFVPGVVAVGGGVPLPNLDVSAFDLETSGLGGFARVVVGGGLFLTTEDVAARAPELSALLGLLVLGMGIVGLRSFAAASNDAAPTASAAQTTSATAASVDRSVVMWSGMVGTMLVVVTAVPLVGSAWRGVVTAGPFGVLRETHKFWPLLALALLLGVATFLRSFAGLAQHALLTGFAALVLGSALPGLLGADGRLEAAALPAGWEGLETSNSRDVGRSVVFPWRRYDSLALADGRTTLQPAPWLVGGIVLTSGDVGNASASVELNQPLQHELALLDQSVRAGRSIAPDLRNLRIDRVIVLNGSESGLYRRLRNEPGVALVHDGPDFWLYEISVDRDSPGGEAQFGLAEDSRLQWSGAMFPITSISAAGVWDRPCERGWFVNAKPVDRIDGVCDLDGASGVLWYPPALLSVAGLLVTFSMLKAPGPRRVRNARKVSPCVKVTDGLA